MHGKWRLLLASAGVALFCHHTVLALAPLPSDEHLTRKFREADANDDGRLSREEYLAMWRYDQNLGREQLQRLDKNREGFISLEEYLAPMREMRRKPKSRP